MSVGTIRYMQDEIFFIHSLHSLQLQRTAEAVDSLEQVHSQTVAEAADMEVSMISYFDNGCNIRIFIAFATSSGFRVAAIERSLREEERGDPATYCSPQRSENRQQTRRGKASRSVRTIECQSEGPRVGGGATNQAAQSIPPS